MTTFKMHDLVHDLALSVAENECSYINSGKQNIGKRVQYLWLDSSDFPKENPFGLLDIDKLSQLRTFCLKGIAEDCSKDFIEKCISKFQKLRVLELQGSISEAALRKIGSLKHLRYLYISEDSIKKLPNSICKLVCLQSLLVPGLEELPKDMRCMINLKVLGISTKQKHLRESGLEHLRSLGQLTIGESENLEYLFDGIENLTSLHTLGIFYCRKLISLPHGLKSLTSLKTLGISGSEEVDLNMRLGCKERLGKEDENYDFQLAGSGSGSGSGLHLQTLLLRGIPKLEAIPRWLLVESANTFKNLSVKECENLTTLSEESLNLTSLQSFRISDCPKLSSLPQRMPSLKNLEIGGCPVLSERCKPETREDWANIAHVTEIWIDGERIAPNK